MSTLGLIEKNEIDMKGVYRLLSDLKQSVDQKYHNLIEDFEIYIDIPKLRDDAIRNLSKKLKKVAISLPEFNAEQLRHKMEYIIPEVIFFIFLIDFSKKFPLTFCLFAYI
jgi:ATP-dependent protease HslVU (ClpYQ) ATPase subunit